jgi:hypothetical protein
VNAQIKVPGIAAGLTGGDCHPRRTSRPFVAVSEVLQDGSGRCSGPLLSVL